MEGQSLKNQQELAQDLAQNLFKLCEELDYTIKAIYDKITLLTPFKELYEGYVMVYEHLKIAGVNLVSDIIYNHIKYLKEQEEALGHEIKIQETRGIPFLEREMEKIIKNFHGS